MECDRSFLQLFARFGCVGPQWDVNVSMWRKLIFLGLNFKPLQKYTVLPESQFQHLSTDHSSLHCVLSNIGGML